MNAERGVDLCPKEKKIWQLPVQSWQSVDQL